MTLIKRIKCATKTNYKNYYANLSKEQLIKHRSSLKNKYFTPIGAWVVALSIMLTTEMALELIILFSGSVISTCALLHNDYKKRYNFIQDLIDHRAE